LDVARVNLILFEPAETQRPLPRADPRAVHILKVLRCQSGETFDVGVINGPRGKATLVTLTPADLVLSFAWSSAPPDRDPVALIMGLPRPQTARDILRDATTLGVEAIHFVRTARSEPGYAQSTLWSSGEWRRHLITGAEQAFDTRIPEVTFTQTLSDQLSALAAGSIRLALDNYEATARLGDVEITGGNRLVIAIGGERGWSADDRTALRTHGFSLVHLGARVLRTETAVIAALSIIRTKLGLM
jgi:16S rRNA (uracil1498-N3)-methyltransferase